MATGAENDLIGFIHYQFCWCRPRAHSALTLEDVALERVVHVESVQFRNACEDDGAKSNECLVLVCLAIEHARHHVIYGMMDLRASIAPLLKTYFRMSEVAPDPTSERVLMACDLLKCSYKYAFHLKKEESLTPPAENVPSKYRLVVQLPTSYRKPILPGRKQSNAADQAAPTKNVMNGQPKSVDQLQQKATGQESTANHSAAAQQVLNGSKPVSIQMRQKPDDCVFANAIVSDRNKVITVRIEKNRVRVTKVPVGRSPQPTTFERVLKQDNWNTISCFRTSTAKTVSTQADTVGSGLKGFQDKLTELEKTNRRVLEKLLSNVRDERVGFETGIAMQNKFASANTVAEYEDDVQRRIESQKALEVQQEEDDNAVCDICADGESTGENRIIFCDSCDVSVHQHCYGIVNVPRGDYFCRACLHFKRDQLGSTQSDDGSQKRILMPLPIQCELCPKRQGAFVQTQVIPKPSDKKPPRAKWVHFLCAKWQGLSIVEGAVADGISVFMIENVQPIKDHFRMDDVRCFLCKGMRGAYNICRHKGCDRWIHVTCARSSGICEVNHGDDHIGPVESENIWTLCCPEHSTFDSDYTPPTNKVPIDQLVALAKTFPVEPKPAPPPEPVKPFYKMSGKERRKRLSEPEYEKEFVGILMKSAIGLRCEVCDLAQSGTEGALQKCATCASFAHEHCCRQNMWKVERLENSVQKYLCNSCVYEEEHKGEEDEQVPECHMCNSKPRNLIRCVAKPMSMKKWKLNMGAYKKSFFGKNIWCHPVCGM